MFVSDKQEFLELDSGLWTPLYICVFMYLYIPDVYIAPYIYMYPNQEPHTLLRQQKLSSLSSPQELAIQENPKAFLYRVVKNNMQAGQ